MIRDAIAAIDIGGTKIALGLAGLDGQPLIFRRFPTRVERGPHALVGEACDELERMAGETGARLVAVGIGCGGPLDRGRGLILSPPNLPGWDEFPIVRLVEERLSLPVLLDNDANAAALGEHEYGAGRGVRNLVYITISTGIGGGLIINDQLVHGVGDGAGEVGHMVVEPGGAPCGCGARGCLEALCSGTSIARRAVERLARDERPSLLREEGGAANITAHSVAVAAQAGDPVAGEVWDETIRYLAAGLSNIIAALAPEAIILGGGVSTSGDQLLVPLRRRVRESVKIMPVEQVRILQASLGGDSGIHGALIIGRRALAAREARGDDDALAANGGREASRA
jgi:glucokinase